MKGMRLINAPKFIVDNNVGKLVKWLRIMGYDTLFFNGSNDSYMIATALAEGRVILTRDTQIVKRRVVASGQLKVVLIQSDKPELCFPNTKPVYGVSCLPPNLLERNTLAGNDQEAKWVWATSS